MADAETDPAVDAVSQLVPATLKALHALEFAGRHLSPATLPQIIEAMDGRDDELGGARRLARPRLAGPPEAGARLPGTRRGSGGRRHRRPARRSRGAAAHRRRLSGVAHLRQERRGALSARRLPAAGQPVLPRAVDAHRSCLERAAGRHRPGSRACRGDACRRAARHARRLLALRAGDYDAGRTYPLVVALHGGSGNGGAFLWSWLREARTRGFLVLAPTAIGSTWSLMDPEIDGRASTAWSSRSPASGRSTRRTC